MINFMIVTEGSNSRNSSFKGIINGGPKGCDLVIHVDIQQIVYPTSPGGSISVEHCCH